MKTKLKQLAKSIIGVIVLIILYAVYLPFGLIRSLIDREWITNFVERTLATLPLSSAKLCSAR